MIIFILGGVRSGKTNFAYHLAKKISKKNVTYLATAVPSDKEMKERIRLHKTLRPKDWITVEEPINILYKNIATDTIIVDCINFWLANMMKENSDEKKILYRTEQLAKKFTKPKINAIVISNEVGNCLVPPNRLGRKFQYLLGKINQIIAKYSKTVYFMISGIPVKIKPR